jgi:hypothetical protein
MRLEGSGVGVGGGPFDGENSLPVIGIIGTSKKLDSSVVSPPPAPRETNGRAPTGAPSTAISPVLGATKSWMICETSGVSSVSDTGSSTGETGACGSSET